MGNNSSVDSSVLPEGAESEKIGDIIRKENFNEYTINVEAGSEKGENYTGAIYRITVEGTGNNGELKKLNLILKCSVRIPSMRAMMPHNLLYQRETTMYTKIIPKFLQMQAEANVKNGLRPQAKLFCYSLEEMDEFMVFQDQKPKGFLMKNRQTTLDFNHCKLVITQLGYLHAFSLALKEKDPQLRQHYCDTLEDVFVTAFKDTKGMDIYLETLQNMVKKAADSLDAESEADIRERFMKFSESSFADMIYNPPVPDDYFVCIHGDCWNNNILFKYGDPENPEIPTDICLLDWQISRWASPAYDLAYFIYNCTGTEFREKHFDELIRIYHNSACEMLTNLGVDPEKIYPFTALEDQINKHFSFGVSTAVNTIHLFTSDGEEIPELTGDITDPAVFAQINYKSKNHDKYNERMGGIIRHATKRNFI